MSKTAHTSEPSPQAKQRRYQHYQDQHGRQWGANIDIRNGHPVSQMEAKFVAPWYPEQQAVKILPDSAGMPWRVEVRYDDMIAQLTRAHTSYLDRMHTIGLELHGQAYDPEHPTVLLRQRVGAPPKAVAPYAMARDGNAFLLGLAPFDETDPSHVAAAEAIGRTTVARLPVPATVTATFRKER